MPATDIIKKIYRPSMQVGQVYARPYGSAQALAEIGNVLELTLEHSEDVKTQMDMTKMGGGVHAEVRRVQEVNLSMKLADLNITNLMRATYGSTTAVDAGVVVEPEIFEHVHLGSLLMLAHKVPANVVVTQYDGTPTTEEDEKHEHVNAGSTIALAHGNPSAVSVKIGSSLVGATPLVATGNYSVTATGIEIEQSPADSINDATLWITYTWPAPAVVPAEGNYVVRPEGIYIVPDAQDIADDATLQITYSYADQVRIEALTTKAVELELVFGGLNEADGGSPCVLEVFRCSQSIAKQLSFIQDNFGALDVSGSVLKDANRVGMGLSQYYRQTVAAAPAV
ncbi:hypothetical protein [Comamonas sp. NLF-1-9]|uniref:hypothetical protein n=1 Tax=Comamonas sp. NLF-1-9 TaxID=2853163 RepID=UPI001C47FB7F|nr:hypothetical protein [Comamonas sp. NLF-1-9]QXL84094.1 hypothetical protein KUD94_12770 [Comamonas sp. NLF-1-9]